MFDTHEGQEHRLLVLGRLNELMKRWIIQTSIEKGKTKDEAQEVGGKIFTFGSYRLGVHGKGSIERHACSIITDNENDLTIGADIDTLLVAPRHIDRSDFFSSFYELLLQERGVTNVRAIQDAFVPVIKLEFEEIEVQRTVGHFCVQSCPERY